MSKHVWKDLAELEPGLAAKQDEFGPEVAAALAQIRAAHGIGEDQGADITLPPSANSDADRFREELSVALPGVNRRGFLQLTGAAAVFALAGCWHKDPDTLVSYPQQPEGTTLGKPVWWSTTLRSGGRAIGVMVKTYDGRPIKLEGNPDCPVNSGAKVRGALDLRTQASLLDLYDPDRRQAGPMKVSGGTSANIGWDQLDQEIGQLLTAGRIGLITGQRDGVANRALLDGLKKAFGDRLVHAAYEPYSEDLAASARKWCYGEAFAKPPVTHVDRADVLVCLGSDFLGGGHTGVAEQIAFGDFRRLRGAGPDADMGQVISFEPVLSQTGTVGDIRVRATMEQVERLAWGIAKRLGVQVPEALKPADGMELGIRPIGPTNEDAVTWTAKRLLTIKAAGRHSLVHVGGAVHNGEISRSLHLAANAINHALGNEGVTVETSSVAPTAVWGDARATAEVLGRVGNDIEVVILAGANPAASLPGAKEALGKAKAVIVLADRADESFAAGQAGVAYLAPTLHGLESWGDAEPSTGVHCLQQPVITSLWDCRASEESLMAFTVATLKDKAPEEFVVEKAPADPHLKSVCSRAVIWQATAHGVRPWSELVRSSWLATVKKAAGVAVDNNVFWTAALAKGVVVVADSMVAAPVFNAAVLAAAQPSVPTGSAYQLVLSASRTMGDGASANNAMLQEIPDPVSRITWDNYLAVSPADADAFGVKAKNYATHEANPVVALVIGGKTVHLPVHVQEGQHPGTVEAFLGWGRPDAGKVAEGAGPDADGGLNAFLLTGPDLNRWGIAIESVTPTGRGYRLACTQGHNTMDGREIVKDDALESFRIDPTEEKRTHHHALWNTGKDGRHHGNLSMWGAQHVYAGRRWGMTVDMTLCTGCQACVVACSIENNVPVVGRDEVRKGREMHWIRVDRYFSSPIWHHNDPSQGDGGVKVAKQVRIERLLDVETAQMPVMCQQCGHAPCEEVCPAMATMHNDEGLNVQIYNRCIGTRYCANNCPYKVRRFNYYEYSKYRSGPLGAGSPLTRVMKNLDTEASTTSSAELSRAPLQMILNPIVGVRSKGVMEKCNFCFQRTRDVREEEKTTGRTYDDRATGATTACAQTCPTKAIVFGDIHDPDSEVNEVAKASPHAYRLLDKELNTRPSVLYLARLRNRPAYPGEKVSEGHGGAVHGEHVSQAPVPGEGVTAPAPSAHGEAH